MATRTQAREAIVGMLYAYDIGNEKILHLAPSMLEEKKIKNKQQDFALSLLRGVLERLDELDSALSPHLKEWEFSRLGGMERALLRLGAYEILYTATDTPVVINEAIELSKMYGGEESAPRLVNGILDSLSKSRSLGNSSLGNHSHNHSNPAPCSARPSAPQSQGGAIVQSNTANTRIVCGEILESQANLESTPPVIASEAKQSIKQNSKGVDCREAIASRNDRDSESPVDSEPTSAVGYSPTAIESSFSSERSSEQALKASSGWGIVKGEGATSQFKPLPLNKKENIESKEVNQALEVKAADSKAIDSESKNRAESAKALDSKKQDSDSKKLESAIDSESKKRASRDISPTAQYDNNLDSKKADFHANKLARKKHANAQSRHHKALESKALQTKENKDSKESQTHTKAQDSHKARKNKPFQGRKSQADSKHAKRPKYTKDSQPNKAHAKTHTKAPTPNTNEEPKALAPSAQNLASAKTIRLHKANPKAAK